MTLPKQIPAGAHVMVRVIDGIDLVDRRMKFCGYVRYAASQGGYTLEMVRNAAANGSRPAQSMTIHQEQTATLKPMPERHDTPPRL